jgi:hypothetical protein
MTDAKTMGIFDAFTDLESLGFKVSMIRLATGCVSRCRDRH